jgi:putative addiction module component (TIGR02574 family)
VKEIDVAEPIPNPPPGFDELTIDEQIDYVQSLWERIAASPDKVPVPAWHASVVRERLAEYRADPTNTQPWNEVRQDLKRELIKRSNKK